MKIGFKVLVAALLSVVSFSASSQTADGHAFSLNDAKNAAVAYFKALPGIPAGTVVHWQKSNSEELTIAVLKQNMGYVGPGNVNYARYQQMIDVLTADPTLQLFTIFLSTGSGDTQTQDILDVRMHIVNGKAVSEVTESH